MTRTEFECLHYIRKAIEAYVDSREFVDDVIDERVTYEGFVELRRARNHLLYSLIGHSVAKHIQKTDPGARIEILNRI